MLWTRGAVRPNGSHTLQQVAFQALGAISIGEQRQWVCQRILLEWKGPPERLISCSD